jgi:hypothetical protein
MIPTTGPERVFGGTYRCSGGQGTDAYEQNTQQSPGLGRMVCRQLGQSHMITQQFVGIVSRVSVPHSGQRIVVSVSIAMQRP